MAFVTKEWKDRLVEFAGRRKLKNVSTNEETVVDVSRNEGSVSQEGDAFSAANMNNLEQRIADGFNQVNSDLTAVNNKLYCAKWESITLSECTPVAAMKYMREHYANNCDGHNFNVVVNNQDYFSGHIYSDGGSTAWGTIQQRTDSIDTITTYQYFWANGGADSVRPFNQLSLSFIDHVAGYPKNTLTYTFSSNYSTCLVVIVCADNDSYGNLTYSSNCSYVELSNNHDAGDGDPNVGLHVITLRLSNVKSGQYVSMVRTGEDGVTGAIYVYGS